MYLNTESFKTKLWKFKFNKLIFNRLFVCFGFNVSLEIFSLISRRHRYRLRNADFYLCLGSVRALKLVTPTMTRPGHLLLMVICEDPWHSNLLSSGVVTTCFYDSGVVTTCFYDFGLVVAPGIPTSNLPLAGPTL